MKIVWSHLKFYSSFVFINTLSYVTIPKNKITTTCIHQYSIECRIKYRITFIMLDYAIIYDWLKKIVPHSRPIRNKSSWSCTLIRVGYVPLFALMFDDTHLKTATKIAELTRVRDCSLFMRGRGCAGLSF